MYFGTSDPAFYPAHDVLYLTHTSSNYDRCLSLFFSRDVARENNRVVDESNLNIGGVHVAGFCERIRHSFFEASSRARVFWFECFTMESRRLEDHDHTSLLCISNAQTLFLFSGGHE